VVKLATSKKITSKLFIYVFKVIPLIINCLENIYYKGSRVKGTHTTDKNWQFSTINATNLLKQKSKICNEDNDTLTPFLLLSFNNVYVSLS